MILGRRKEELFPPLISHALPFYIFRPPRHHPSLLFQPHWHEYIFEVIYVAKGHARFHIGEETIHAVKGDVFLIREGVLHAGEAIDTVPDYYAILFDRHLLSNPGLPDYEIPRLSGRLPPLILIKPDDDLYERFIHPIQNIAREYDHKELGYGITIKGNLIVLVNEITRHFSEDGPTQRTRKSEERVFSMLRNVTKYVSDHYSRRITLDEISSYVNMSPHYFCHQFKSATGRTFTEYVNMVRIDKAAKLITETDLSITEISMAVGFCNTNYFGKLFRRYNRCTPTQFRGKHKERR